MCGDKVRGGEKMGFINAVMQMGTMDEKEGIEAYLKFPLDGNGRIIRVFLDIPDLDAKTLKVCGVKKVDLADLKRTEEMKLKYLYRDRIGANINWGFTPLHKLGKPKATLEGNRKYFMGEKGVWEEDKNSQLYKIKSRVLDDYEKEGVFVTGSVDTIMRDLPSKIDGILDQLDNKVSHIVIFGAEKNENFIYPGEIPSMVNYFVAKLQKSLKGEEKTEKKNCALCHNETYNTYTLDKVFKFATFDKVSILPGLNKRYKVHVFPLCSECLKKVTAGRERVERTLTNTESVPGIRIWVIPEGTGTGASKRFNNLVNDLEKRLQQGSITSIGEKREEGYFQRLARGNEGLIFHFLFWERNNSQEMVHLMVEDVPPERLARLEKLWNTSMKRVLGDVERGLNLDWTIKSLYATLNSLAGKSNSDKIVFRDFSLKLLGKMLQGDKLPVMTFKKFVVSRVNRLVHESSEWDNVQKTMLYAQVWVEFMNMINGEV
jgi:CRISPR-associated protein Csh1